jgi:hypothetical protein
LERCEKQLRPNRNHLISLDSFKLQRHTAAAIVDQFGHDDIEEVVCNIAGWRNQDYNGPYLTVELSPRFVARMQAEGDDIIDSILNDKEGDIEDI